MIKKAIGQMNQVNQATEAMGFVVTETVVWTRGKSRAFSPEEIQAGKAEDWLKANKAGKRGKR